MSMSPSAWEDDPEASVDREEIELHHAGEAQRILGSETFRKAVSELRNHWLTQWESSKPDEMEMREQCWRAIQALHLVQGQLHSVISSGKMVEGSRANRRRAADS